MPARKIRVEVFDRNGDRYTITFEGNVTREKALYLLDLVELLGGVSKVDTQMTRSALSKIDKIYLVIERNFPIGFFSSKNIQAAYEKEFKEPISLSTVSTYLSRMVERGLLMKNGSYHNRRYKMLTNPSRVLTRYK
jgi:hypothetical protein